MDEKIKSDEKVDLGAGIKRFIDKFKDEPEVKEVFRSTLNKKQQRTRKKRNKQQKISRKKNR